ncbi:damage-inducible protein DinB [Ottowia sp. GY511]|uniref:DinB family protein n=1 Tax=Ottowia flava TaxID=2675430 RepID=A0ABW4KR11_9BURK|nr:DinB family protein [Ottowia sp. GY511]TXK30895.1 damage-inducible protein DinB [Ottowia sp. GY511]
MDLVAYFTTLARYNVWATQRLLDAVAVLPDDDYRRDVGLFFKSIHGTLNHLLVGEVHLWQVRFIEGQSQRIPLDTELEADRARLGERLLEGATRWPSVIAAIAPERWASTLDYVTNRGTFASLPFAPTLAHVFNHSTHHRAQITAALTALGQRCPELDLVYMLQQEQKPA